MGLFKGCVQSSGSDKECDELSQSDSNQQVPGANPFPRSLLTVYSSDAWGALKRARGAGIVGTLALGIAVLCCMRVVKTFKRVSDAASAEVRVRALAKLTYISTACLAVAGICLIVCTGSLRAIVDGRNSWLRGRFGQNTQLQYETDSGHTLAIMSALFVWLAVISSVRTIVLWRHAVAAAAQGQLQFPQGNSALLGAGQATPSPGAVAVPVAGAHGPMPTHPPQAQGYPVAGYNQPAAYAGGQWQGYPQAPPPAYGSAPPPTAGGYGDKPAPPMPYGYDGGVATAPPAAPGTHGHPPAQAPGAWGSTTHQGHTSGL